MGVRKTVFGSSSERRVFEHLSRQWGGTYRLYHNLPFLMVFDTSNLIEFSDGKYRSISLDPTDVSRLKKTSIDFTLCDENDQPILCVEFDGLCDGFNVGAVYHTDYPEGPWREIIMTLKLRVAHGSLFPFFVVGSPQFERLSSRTELAIIDGIIGDVLSHRSASRRFANGFHPEDVGMTKGQFDDLSPSQQHEVIQDWVIGVEVEADIEHNPIYHECATLAQRLGHPPYRIEYTQFPNIDHVIDPAKRAPLIEKALLQGAKVTVRHPQLGESSAIVMLPNFKTVGVSPFSLAEELACLIALDRLAEGNEPNAQIGV